MRGTVDWACTRATGHYSADHSVAHNGTNPQDRVGHLYWTCCLKGAWTCQCDFPPTAAWLHTSDPPEPLPCRPRPTTDPASRHEPRPQVPPLPTGPSPQASPHLQGVRSNTFSCSRRCSSQALSTSTGCDSPRAHRAPHTCSCTRGSLSVMASSRMVDSPTVTKSDGRVRPGPGPPPGSASEDSASPARPLQPQAHTPPPLSTVLAEVSGTH